MGGKGAGVEGHATVPQFVAQACDQVVERRRRPVRAAPDHPRPGEGTNPVQGQFEDRGTYPSGGGLGATALLRGDGAQKHQGEVDVFGVGQASMELWSGRMGLDLPGGDRVPIRGIHRGSARRVHGPRKSGLHPGQGQALGLCGPEGEKEPVSHR